MMTTRLSRRGIAHGLTLALTAAAAVAAPSRARAQRTGTPTSTTHRASMASAARPITMPRIAFEKYTLPNGLEVILHENHTTPIVAVDTWYHVGSSDELPGRTGFAHLFEHLMFMGSQHVPTGRFDQLLESAGGENNGSTTEDRTNYYEIVPSNALALALYLDSDRMGYLLAAIDQHAVDVQRDVVKNERRQRVDNVPYGRSDETIRAALYPKTHPYSWPVIGSMADLSAATVEDVKNFFRTYYAPNNATLVISGDFKPAEAKALIAKYFSEIPRGPAMRARPTPATFMIPRDTFLTLEDRVQLPRVTYSWSTPPAYTQDDATLDVLADILARGKNSRLYRKLVYETQVAQDVSAFEGSGRLTSLFQISATPRPGMAPAKVDSLIRSEVATLIANGVTDRELARAKNSRASNMLRGLGTDLGVADQLNEYNYFAGDPGFFQKDVARYNAVTRADVQRAAATFLTRPKVVLTVVPEGKTGMTLTAPTGGSR